MVLVLKNGKIKMNPFLASIKLTVYKSQTTMLNNRNVDGINKVVSKTIEEIEWEKDPFIKVYTESKIKNIYKDLNPISCKIVLYIQLNLKKKTDYIELNTDKVMDFTKIESKTTYYKYIQELIDNAVIAKYKNSVYWINPELIFNGDRISFYKEQCPDCIEEINLKEIQENKRIKKKQDLIKHFKFANYYQLKENLGNEQIEKILNNQLLLSDVVFLKKKKEED